MVAQLQDNSESAIGESDRMPISDSVYFFGAGVVLAVFATIVTVTIDALAITFTQQILNRNVCLDGFGDTTIVVLLGVAIITSLLVGTWIYRFRNAVAKYSDPGIAERSRLIRRRFSWGSMGLYVAAAPFTWLLMLGMAYCNAGAGA